MRELLDDLMHEPSGNPSTSVFPRSSAGPAADVLMPARLGRAPCRGWSWQNFTTRRRGKRREQEEEVARSERRAAEREAVPPRHAGVSPYPLDSPAISAMPQCTPTIDR